MRQRMFYIDGDRQMVGEPDGTVHEADPNDPDLIALRERLAAYIAESAAEEREAAVVCAVCREPFVARADDPVAHIGCLLSEDSEGEKAALTAGTHVPAVDDFGNEYLERVAADREDAKGLAEDELGTLSAMAWAYSRLAEWS